MVISEANIPELYKMLLWVMTCSHKDGEYGNESGEWIMREATSQVSSMLEHLAMAMEE